ncbi:hypothetical protein CKO28_24120 [Rhodovibrio sodomensis]|uniref:Uncharacterized protein n=1 Tax=Rhodovibrio sodomensis TaxID=1088 RepID=A0ABS1DLV6_9PROT|nr:hypothetical protein [Rhodovibrio sodomensis]MBK1671098.1 hypothetical protein [Rhodovibrio sodomensis]
MSIYRGVPVTTGYGNRRKDKCLEMVKNANGAIVDGNSVAEFFAPHLPIDPSEKSFGLYGHDATTGESVVSGRIPGVIGPRHYYCRQEEDGSIFVREVPVRQITPVLDKDGHPAAPVDAAKRLVWGIRHGHAQHSRPAPNGRLLTPSPRTPPADARPVKMSGVNVAEARSADGELWLKEPRSERSLPDPSAGGSARDGWWVLKNPGGGREPKRTQTPEPERGRTKAPDISR